MTNLTYKRPECIQLLSQLKSTVDELLASCRVDVLNMYGGLERLVLSTHSIISHQYQDNKEINKHEIDVWPFLYEVFRIKTPCAAIVHAINKTDGLNRSMLWLERSLLGYTLSQQLMVLIEHKEVIQKYYADDCFLLQSQFSSALLICLRAIELNDPSLLAEVNVLKLSSECSKEELTRSNSSSFSHDSSVNLNIKEGGIEDFIGSGPVFFSGTPRLESIQDTDGNSDIVSSGSTSCNFSSNHKINKRRVSTNLNNSSKDEPFLPAILKGCDLQKKLDETLRPAIEKVKSNEDKTENQLSEKLQTDHKMKSPNHGRSVSDMGLFLKTRPDVATVHETRSEDKLNVHTDRRTHQRHSSYFFKQPREGQSLISFFMSHNFNSCTDLDRENAHFNFAETLLSVIEQVKWNQTLTSGKAKSDEKPDDNFLQRIRIRKLAGKKQKYPENKLEFEGSLTSGSEDSFHGDDVDDSSLSEFSHNNLQIMRENGVSLSLASLYSDADFGMSSRKDQSELARSDDNGKSFTSLSADIIAIKLLKKFSNLTLPKASDIEWPCTEDRVLSNKNVEPFPKNSVEDCGESDSKQLRGSHEWAPPRPQIIAIIHEKPKLLEGLLRQNNRCAGCGSPVERSCAKRYIFCEYLGKYFCPCCHNKSKSIIPARVLVKWDFGLYPISFFAYEFLCKNRHEPWFHVSLEMYKKVTVLSQVKQCRVQLYYLRQFIQACQSKDRPEDIFNCPFHWFASINSIDSFSLLELEMVKKKQFLPLLQEKADICLSHIKQCVLCQARGFFCEVCKKADDIIFPFEIQRVTICQSCKASFHKQCFNPNSCPKCARLLQRKKTRLAT